MRKERADPLALSLLSCLSLSFSFLPFLFSQRDAKKVKFRATLIERRREKKRKRRKNRKGHRDHRTGLEERGWEKERCPPRPSSSFLSLLLFLFFPSFILTKRKEKQEVIDREAKGENKREKVRRKEREEIFGGPQRHRPGGSVAMEKKRTREGSGYILL